MKGPRIVEYLYLCITDSACSFKQSEIDEENVLSLSYEIIYFNLLGVILALQIVSNIAQL